MLFLNAERIRELAPIRDVIECLREAFRREWTVPPRQIAEVPGGQGGRFMFLMPAFGGSGGGAVKIATLFPDNATKGVASVQAIVIVFSEDGSPRAVLDGTEITRLRTSAASALASSYLSRAGSAHLTIIGDGALAPYMAAAHCAVRPITAVTICGKSPDRIARTLTATQSALGPEIEIVAADSPAQAVASADIVSCATNSPTPVLEGKWLKPGTFVDLVGSFVPTRRESDDDVVRNTRIFVDTFEGVLAEAGDLLDPLRRGVIMRNQIEAELSDLVTGRKQGRDKREEITLFKSVGTAIEDLATANLILNAHERIDLDRSAAGRV